MRVLAVAAVLVSCAPGPDTEPTPLEQRVPSPNWGDLVIPTTTTTSTTVPVPVTAPSTTAPPLPPQTTAPRPVATTTAPQTVRSGPWNALANCESGGNWHTDTGNGYSGGLQWSPSTWAAYRSPGDPARAADASRAQEVAAGKRLVAAQGDYGAWPHCARRLGLPT